jgi:hypothetical protein
MPSEIRALLADAQQAESSGDVPGAVRRLQQAAEFYRARRMIRRAEQMQRHIDRLEGRLVSVPLDQISDRAGDAFDEDDDVIAHVLDDAPFVPSRALADDGLGFGDELLSGSEVAARAPGAEAPAQELSAFDRGPQPADPSLDAWCSFCCRPKAEVGSLIAGPAGAFICASCIGLSARAMAVSIEALPSAPAVAPAPRPRSSVELPGQSSAKATWDRRKPRVALVVGPEGTGKTTFLESLGRPAPRPLARLEDETALVDLSSPLSPEEEHALIQWLDAHPKRRAVLAARGDAPTPVLVLRGEHGDEPVYDTDSLHHAVSAHLSPSLLSKVDAVLPLPRPDRDALRHLAQSLLAARGIELPADSVGALVALAERSGRGARELAALVARIPSGRYSAR